MDSENSNTVIIMKPPQPRLMPEYGDIPPPPSCWPRSREGVIQVAHDWYQMGHARIDEKKIEELPAGTITPMAEEENIMGSTIVGSPKTYLSNAEASIVIGAINHMFWDVKDGEFIRYQHEGKVGALAMTQAVEKAWSEQNSPLWRARHKDQPLTLDGLTEVFGDIPAPEPRLDILNEILLSEKLPHMAQVAQRTGMAHDPMGVDMASKLADAFPLGYADELLKKAQLTVSGLWRQARQCGSLSTTDVTAFADYQIPNVLRAMGMLSYAPELDEKIDRGELILANSDEERSIRAASVLAVDLISAQQDVAVADVDYWLWLRRGQATTPFHRTRTTLY